MSKAKKCQWPVAKYAEDGTPAVWLSHTVWLLLRGSLVSEYVKSRERIGKREARRALKCSELHDSWPFDEGQARAALELYQVGYKAWHHVAARNETQESSPEELSKLGDIWQARGFEEETKRLQPAPDPVPAADTHNTFSNGRYVMPAQGGV